MGDLGLIPGLGRSPGERKASHSSILAWRIPWTIYIVHGVAESDTTERLSLHFTRDSYCPGLGATSMLAYPVQQPTLALSRPLKVGSHLPSCAPGPRLALLAWLGISDSDALRKRVGVGGVGTVFAGWGTGEAGGTRPWGPSSLWRSGNHSSILARRIPWTEEPGRLQSMGLQRVGHD